ncbi:MAG: tetratricopeptide repeat protein [Terriglobia bacterium]|jgi:tetratricopeptide (TPR) repeat protein
MPRPPGQFESPSLDPAALISIASIPPARRCSLDRLGLGAVLLILALARATAAQSPDPHQLFQQADEAQQLGDTELAIRKYQEVIRLDPKMIAARANLGIVLVSLGRFDEAIAQYHAALAQAPTSDLVLRTLFLATCHCFSITPFIFINIVERLV